MYRLLVRFVLGKTTPLDIIKTKTNFYGGLVIRKSKIKNTLKISLSIIMVVVICIVTMGSVPTKIYTAYIDPQLKEVLSVATATDLIPVDIWLYEIDTNKVEEKVLAKTGFSKASFNNEKTAAEVTHAEVDAYIETERAVYAEAQTEQSEEFLNKHSKVFGSRTSAGGNLLFVSRYAPVIQAELTPAQIATMAKDLSVEAIYYSPEQDYNNASTVGNSVTGAGYARDTLGLTGSGIKIGILEASEKIEDEDEIIYTGGLPARGTHNIPLNKIAFDPDARDDDYNNDGQVDTSTHASMVAAIIMGQDDGTYEGVVPDAMVYATFNSINEDTGERRSWRECAEWLIGRGVNVINMSMSAYSSNGAYNSNDRWADHIIMQHRVHVVVAAGNYNESIGKFDHYVTSPAIAYNVITVGNLNDMNTLALTDDSIHSSSCYQEGSNIKYPPKPDIVAPGTNIATHYTTDTIHTGTSFAAPFVTGIVAQLCQAESYLKTNPAAVKAILCASAATEPHSYVPTDTNYDKYGAGLVNAQYAYNTTVNVRFDSNYFPPGTEGGENYTHSFYISSTKSKVKIALTWLNYKIISSNSQHSGMDPVNEYTLADLDLRIYDEYGNQVGQSLLSNGNVEIVELENASAGSYDIRVEVYTGSSEPINYSVAWWY